MKKMQKYDHSVLYMSQLPSRQILVNLESIQKNPTFPQGNQVNSNHSLKKKKNSGQILHISLASQVTCIY